MDLRQLEHFIAVADERSFTRAARRVHIVQSALSTSIRSLELELGAELFARTTRRVSLTAAGTAFYEKAKIVLAAAKAARESIVGVQGLQRGTLKIGVVQTLDAFIDLPALLEAFHARCPGIEIQLVQENTRALLERVREDDVPIAFTPIVEVPPGVATRAVACEGLVLICAPGHPLAGLVDVPLTRLQHEAFVDFSPDFGTRKIIDRAFLEAQVQRRTAFEVGDLATLFELVARGLGVALVPETVALGHTSTTAGRRIAISELGPPEICWELVVAFASSGATDIQPRNPVVRAFLSLLAQESVVGV